MRLWSLHPKYLDQKGLVALWREGLLAQKVLQGKTKGYRNHPQLARFKDAQDPRGSVSQYLRYVHEEAQRRHYHFQEKKILPHGKQPRLQVTQGQLDFERRHLLKKCRLRDKMKFKELKTVTSFEPHPLFRVVSGAVEPWEIR